MDNQLPLCNKSKSDIKHNFLLCLLAIATILLMYKSQSILWVRSASELLISEFGLVIYLIFALIYRKKYRYVTTNEFISICFLSLAYFHEIIWVGELTILGIIMSMSILICSVILIMSSLEIKLYILKIYVNVTTCLVLISLIGWILLICGIPLPYYVDNSNVYYTHVVYYIFNLNMTSDNLIPRFAGLFLEPGHLGTMCIFLLYIDGFKLSKIKNIILLFGALASFSLAAYGLLCIAIFLLLIQRGKIKWIIASGTVFVIIGIISYQYNYGDNLLYTYIYSRLEIKDGELAGNNRTTSYFDVELNKYSKTSQIWLGKGQAAFGSGENAGINITLGCAGYKRYFFIRGIIGITLLCLFIISYFNQYASKKALGFLIVFIVANLIRDYPLKPIWLYLFIMAIPYLSYKYKLFPNANSTH